MRINFFTPLPPAATDIARCVERSVRALVEAFDVTFWTDAEKVDPAFTKIAKVRRFRPDRMDWRDVNYADWNVYNIGNDPSFHAAIALVARRAPGIVILHDACVHELVHGTLQRTASPSENYLVLLSRIGPQAVEDGRAVAEGRVLLQSISAKYPLADWICEGALGIVTHNPAALRAALPNCAVPVLETPLPWLPLDELPASAIHAREGGPLEMVVCGFLNSPNRRLPETLEAIAAFPRRSEILLHIAGRVKEEKRLRKRIAELGLSRNVKLHGYLSEKALTGLLGRVHLAVNLRWPSMGEASGSQLRFWNHCLPTIATATGWYADQPAGTLHLVRPECERDDLHEHWNKALEDYPSFARAGLAGRALLAKRHSSEGFAQALAAFFPVVNEARSRAFAPILARRAGLAAASLGIGPDALKILAERVGFEIATLAGVRRQAEIPS
jgi:glycosyltransferase involved in cell wall biosynthesis